jgi:hypothetical protein
MIIDELMPRYDVATRHTIEVHASPAAAYEALQHADFAKSGVLRMLTSLRALPARLLEWRRQGRVRQAPPRRLVETLATLEKAGFVLLADVPPTELVLGIEGRFWALDGGRCTPPAASFRTTVPQAGTARAVWGFHFAPLDATRTLVTTQTRVLCADAAARHRFLPYWFVIRPASGLIRRVILRQLRDEAERRIG